uniref:Uncharacterized protein n=1 Tax=Romanomermis culicivorax TaxID=13658 RepID=A0A915KLB1_ROMCU
MDDDIFYFLVIFIIVMVFMITMHFCQEYLFTDKKVGISNALSISGPDGVYPLPPLSLAITAEQTVSYLSSYECNPPPYTPPPAYKPVNYEPLFDRKTTEEFTTKISSRRMSH